MQDHNMPRNGITSMDFRCVHATTQSSTSGFGVSHQKSIFRRILSFERDVDSFVEILRANKEAGLPMRERKKAMGKRSEIMCALCGMLAYHILRVHKRICRQVHTPEGLLRSCIFI